jgi:hypothetical protein
MRQQAANQDQIARIKSFHGPADVTEPAALANPDQFHFVMIMPKEMDGRFEISAYHECM